MIGSCRKKGRRLIWIEIYFYPQSRATLPLCNQILIKFVDIKENSTFFCYDVSLKFYHLSNKLETQSLCWKLMNISRNSCQYSRLYFRVLRAISRTYSLVIRCELWYGIMVPWGGRTKYTLYLSKTLKSIQGDSRSKGTSYLCHYMLFY